jgi:uncharacterized membrane protein
MAMSRRSKRTATRENAAAVADLAAQLAADRTFRKRLLKAIAHGMRAERRVWRQVGLVALVNRLAADRQLRAELAQMLGELQGAWRRVERTRSHRLRNTLVVVGGAGGLAAAAAPPTRARLGRALAASRAALLGGPRTITEVIEVEVPVSTAYNQWTQFEEFPRFMDGVQEVRQLDDTRLHWAAEIGGRRAEWDAKIIEQHPDRQISWISEDGRKTRGTVAFESLGATRTLITLSMSYRAQGLREAAGSAAGIDRRRVRGDLERFKQLIEERGSESGGWRGDISEGSAAGGESDAAAS